MSDSQPFTPPPRTWVRKFSDAGIGIWWGVCGQSSFLVHGICFAAVALLGLGLGIQAWQWVAVLLASALVMSLELVNSAVETLARAVTDRFDGHLDRALKISSGAVLLAALFAVMVGAVVFLPPIWQGLIGIGPTAAP